MSYNSGYQPRKWSQDRSQDRSQSRYRRSRSRETSRERKWGNGDSRSRQKSRHLRSRSPRRSHSSSGRRTPVVPEDFWPTLRPGPPPKLLTTGSMAEQWFVANGRCPWCLLYGIRNTKLCFVDEDPSCADAICSYTTHCLSSGININQCHPPLEIKSARSQNIYEYGDMGFVLVPIGMSMTPSTRLANGCADVCTVTQDGTLTYVNILPANLYREATWKTDKITNNGRRLIGIDLSYCIRMTFDCGDPESMKVHVRWPNYIVGGGPSYYEVPNNL